jgi:predicted nucleic acid-binding protein
VILYLDSSSLVKIYLEEAESDLVREWVGAAEAIATSRVAYPETLSAFTRRRQQGDLDSHAFDLLRESLDSDWTRFVLMPVKERRAGALAVRHVLRGFDAIHLAAVSDLREVLTGDRVVFSSFDGRLLRAARAEGVAVLFPQDEDAR